MEFRYCVDPRHSEVQGYKVADRLAKEAAMEAKELEEETSIVTVQDIKRHARVSCWHQVQVAAKMGYWGVQARFLPLQTLP